MTRAQKKIHTRATALGWTVSSLKWTPLGRDIEMQGREGGWVLQAVNQFDRHVQCIGSNVDLLVEDMNYTNTREVEYENRYFKDDSL